MPWIPDVSDTEELIGRVPNDVEVVLAPLATGVDSDSMKLLGKTYRREEVVSRYMAEYEKYGHIPNTSWVKPTPPPQENDPLFRLPVLPASGGPS